MPQFTPTARTILHRRPNRASYDREIIHAILDEGLHCHVGFTVDDQPYVIPTIHARVEDRYTFTALVPAVCYARLKKMYQCV